MGKVYIGVTAVGGHKLWGVSGKRVAGLGGLGNGWATEEVTAGNAKLRAGHARPLRRWMDERVLVGVSLGL